MTDDGFAPVLGPIGTLLEQAYGYAGIGLDIFPVNPRDKTPLVSQHGATTDLDTIEAWWTQWPDALLGHRISRQQLILDIDPRHGGKDTWNALKEQMPEVITRTHYSGRGDGGGHVWFQRPADNVTITKLDVWAKEHGTGHEVVQDNAKKRWVCGIDILRWEHRYTILPPSLHPATGRPYYWAQGKGLNLDPAPMPGLLVGLIERDERPVPTEWTGPRFRDPESIADWYSDEMPWSQLLRSHDWVLVGGDGDSDESRWRHPQATSVVSATIRHGCLFVYSPNTPFEVTYPDEPKGYTPFRAYALLEHAGDLSAAGRAAREMRGPVQSIGPSSNGSATKNGPRELILTPASDIPPRRVRWCWDGRLALGTLGLLAGPEGLGKSTLAYTVAADITRGTLPGEYHGQPRAVLVCASEDSWAHTIVPRLMAAGTDLCRVYRIEIRLSDDIMVGLSLPLDIQELEQAAESVGAALLILDPLMSRLDGVLDSHKDGDVRRALEPLVSIADNTGMAILGLIHHNKSGSTDPLQLVMASKAFTAVARSVHTVVRDPDDETGLRRYFGTPKNNLGSIDVPTLTFTIESWFYDTADGQGATGRIVWGEEKRETIADLLARSAQDPEQRTALQDAKDWLTDYIADHGGSVAARDALNAGKAATHAERTLQRARKELGFSREKEGLTGGWVWKAPNLPTPSPSPNLGALAPSGLPAAEGAKEEEGAKGDSPHAREAPSGTVDPDDPALDRHLYGPDGVPWCRFGKGLSCRNGDRCLNPNHRPAS